MNRFSVVIPWWQGSSKRRMQIFEWILDRYIKTWDETQIEIVVGGDVGEVMNRSAARNRGIEMATSDIVLIADADTAFDKESIESAVAAVESGVPWAIPYGVSDYYNLTQEYSDILLTSDPLDSIANPVWEHKIQSWAGLLVCRKIDWERVGKYDERFHGWGWEDVAFRVKLDAVVGPLVRIPGRALHLWHERTDADFGSKEELANRRLFDIEYRRRYNWKDERFR